MDGHDSADRFGIDTSVAHSARIHNYWLGGKDNFAADRAAGDAVIAAYPGIVQSVRANRAFLARVARFLAAEAGVRQFLDIGTGIPAANNTHEVVHAAAPDARVVYVDYDPVVLLHARTLLTSGASGAIDYIDADLRDPGTIVREAARTLDFSRPVAIMLIAIMHLIGDADDPYGLVAQLTAAVPPGSYLALSRSLPTSSPSRWPRRRGGTTGPPMSSSGTGRTPRCRGSSTASSWLIPVWWPCSTGGRGARSRPAPSRRCGAASDASA